MGKSFYISTVLLSLNSPQSLTIELPWCLCPMPDVLTGKMHRPGRTACTIPCNFIKHVCVPDPTSTLFALPSIRSVKNAFNLCASSQSNKSVALDWDELSLMLCLPFPSLFSARLSSRPTIIQSTHSLLFPTINSRTFAKSLHFSQYQDKPILFHDLSYEPSTTTSRFLQHERHHPSKSFAYNSLRFISFSNHTPTPASTISI